MTTEQDRLELLGCTLSELSAWCQFHDIAKFRSKQIFQWLYQQQAKSFAEMKNLPKSLQQQLSLQTAFFLPEIVKEQISQDGTTAKLLLKMADGVLIEIVLMLYQREQSRNRQTVCISTQAGCAMGCKFCATGLQGLERNLTAGEIVGQVLVADRWCRQRGYSGVSNVVYMGMGEPLANLSAVLKSIAILNEELGLRIGQRRLTVSTCGLVPQIRELAEQRLAIGLAVSLHGATDSVRSKLMPINRRYVIDEVLAACDDYVAKTGRRISYEYALLQGINDDLAQAKALAGLLKGRLAHVNLIPVNYVAETGFLPSDHETMKQFAAVLTANRIETTIREKKGIDIDAACGQLRQKHLPHADESV